MRDLRLDSHFYLVVLFLSWVSGAANCEIPHQINHQGVVRVNGEPFSGTGEFRFAFIDEKSGDAVWTNDGSSLSSLGFPVLGIEINVVGGLYSVILGDASLSNMIPIPSSAFDSENIVLRIWFNDGPNGVHRLAPDHPMTSTPYSFHSLRAGDADTLDGFDSSDFLSQGPNEVNMLIGEFVVAAGESVDMGDVVSFAEGTPTIKKGYLPAGMRALTDYNPDTSFTADAAGLDSSRFVIVYRDFGAGGVSRALVGGVAGDQILFGSPETITANFVGELAVASLSPDRIVVVYEDGGNSNWGVAKIGEVVGDTIQFGNGVFFNISSTQHLAVAALSENRFAMAYRDGAPPAARTRVGDASGTQISFGFEEEFAADSTYRISIAGLSHTDFVISYVDSLSDEAFVVHVDTTTNMPVVGTPTRFVREECFRTSCFATSSTEFIVAYDRSFQTGVSYGAARVGELLGDSISLGNEIIFMEPSPSEIEGSRLSGNRFVLALERSGIAVNIDAGDWLVGQKSGRQIDYISEGTFNLKNTFSIALAALPPNRFVVPFNRQNGHGEIAFVQIEPEPIIGIARKSGMEGGTVAVTLLVKGALSDSHSGLQTGTIYFGQPDGIVSTDEDGVRLGIAVSSTELLLNP